MSDAPAPPPIFGTHEEGWAYVPRPGAYAVAPDASGRILCIVVPTGLYLPGGGIEKGESPEDAVLRELLEETAFMGRVVSVLGRADQRVVASDEDTAYLKQCTFLHVALGSARSTPAEHDIGWVSPAEALRELREQVQAWALRRYLARRPERQET